MNFLYRIYFGLPNFARLGITGKAINKIMGMVLKKIFDSTVPNYLKRTVSRAGSGINKEEREKKYIVSLTSFPARINELWITIETILRQNFKADKIILWLALEQFPDRKLPESLTCLKDRGLEIVFCDEDLRSHKKYFYAMQKYPNDVIITLDDDHYYGSDVLENLFKLHVKYPDLVVTNRGHEITYTAGIMNPYRKWKHNISTLRPSFKIVPTGCGGILYPPNALNKEFANQKVFKEICFHADDLWLKTMAILNNTMAVTNKKYNKDFVTVGVSQKEKLVADNVFNGGNDEQFKKVLSHYRIKNEQFFH